RTGVQALDRREILEELHRIELRIHAEVLRQVAESGAQGFRMRDHVVAVPAHAAFGRLGDRGQDAHQGGLAGAVGAEEPDHSGVDGQRELPQGPKASAVALGNVLDLESHAALRAGVDWCSSYGRAAARVAAGGAPGREARMAGTAYPFSALIVPTFLFLLRAFEGRRGDKPASSGRLR